MKTQNLSWRNQVLHETCNIIPRASIPHGVSLSSKVIDNASQDKRAKKAQQTPLLISDMLWFTNKRVGSTYMSLPY